MGRSSAADTRRLRAPPPPTRPRPRAAGALDTPVPSPVAEQQAWLEARFAREDDDAPALSPQARVAVAVAGAALSAAMLTAGVLRALAWLGG